MSKRLMYVEGLDGQVELLSDRVVIHRKGLWQIFKYGLNATREIPLGAIAEVVFKNAGKLVFGQIEFIRAGRSQHERKKDYGAVRFKKDKQREFEILKEKIFELVDQYARSRQP